MEQPSAGPPAETFDELYDHAPVGYVTTLPDGIVTRANDTLAGWLGLPRLELIGQRIQAILTPGARIFYETHCAPILQAEGHLSLVALDLRRADGGRLPALLDWRRVADAEDRLLGYRIMLVDGSERRSYERELLAERERAREAAAELARLNAELEARVEARTAELVQVRKMETLGQLTGGVAHDFNNLLTPIVACLDILSRKGNLDDRGKRLVAAASEGAERAKLLVDRLLAFARRQRLEAQDVELPALIWHMKDLIARSIGPMVGIEVEAGLDLPPARVDPHQLELAVLNLCVNGRDAMEGDGRITIRLDHASIGPGHPSRLPPGAYVSLQVADTGAGMDVETLSRATEPFFTTKGPGRGTGLGLSMAQGLAQQSGGELLIESAPGQGTTVTILLPAAERSAQAPRVAKAEKRRPATPPLDILLVDDEDIVRSAVSQMLRELGHRVREAASGPHALDILVQGAPDLLVTDYAMPGMTGAALAMAAREARPGLPVLIVSGYAAVARMEAETLPCLSKPFSPAELSGAIALAYGQGGNQSGTAAAQRIAST